ncbi:MAG TPA: hypothetical protein VK717_13875 [Opitutaceae bacterium]|jgi:hypothetical protein|nr:hypothetical protein [Opitutaceae bacterium]
MKNELLFCAALAVTAAQLYAQGTGLVVSSNNTVGIGTSTPAAMLDISNPNNPTVPTSYDPGNGTPITYYVSNLKSFSTFTPSNEFNIADVSNFSYLALNPSGITNDSAINTAFVTTIPQSNTVSFSSNVTGISNSVSNYGSGFTGTLTGMSDTVSNAVSGPSTVTGLSAWANNTNPANVPNLYGQYIVANNSGTVTNDYGSYVFLRNATMGNISNRYGVYIALTNVNRGTVANDYGLYISGIAAGVHTNMPYDVYVADSGAYNYFAGNVGIGTATPAYALDVAGQVHATSFVSATQTYADFVFKPGYRLPPLSDVEASIKKAGHLPGIPSEDEAKAHGIDLTQMQVQLLQKIEELTLHQIEQEKRLNEQSKDIEQLQKENVELREKLIK